jgi:pilus assembly protein Flp/PilA
VGKRDVREDRDQAVPAGRRLLGALGRGDGQGLVEYALILVLVAIIVIAVLTTMGPQLSTAFKDVVNEVSRTRS